MFYIFKSTGFNITNLPQYCLFLSRSDFYGPCQPFLNQGRLDINVGEFTKDMCPVDPVNFFRHINWATKIDLLKHLEQQQKNVVWAVQREEQLHYLKEQFKTNALTIATTWDNNRLLLEHLAKFHVKMQDTGVFEITDNDKNARAQGVDLVKHYINEFDQIGLVPKASLPCADYNIPITDYFDQTKFFVHLKNIGADLTPQVISFYKDWLASSC